MAYASPEFSLRHLTLGQQAAARGTSQGQKNSTWCKINKLKGAAKTRAMKSWSAQEHADQISEVVSLLSDGAKADTLTASHVFVIRIMDVAEAKVLLTDPAVLGHGTGGKIRDHPSRLDPRNKHAFCKTAVLGKRRQRPMSMDNPLYKTMMTRVKPLME